uniref:Galaxin-like repeats domain-containing protein n=1 Tax=Clytia hemisphaerica TaxID=252671 RepID=A0A7M5WYR6_9CNID
MARFVLSISLVVLLFGIALGEQIRPTPPVMTPLIHRCPAAKQKWRYCGGERYDRVAEFCCDGVKLAKEPFKRCCGKRLYDIESEGCRNGFVFGKEKRCRGRTYDPKDSFCHRCQVFFHNEFVYCDGSLYPKTSRKQI